MTEREAIALSGIALFVSLLAAIWFAKTDWPGAGVMGLIFAGWAVMLLVKHGVRSDSDEEL